MIEQIMEYNKKFVENKGYEPYITSKYPDKKIAILTVWTQGLWSCCPPPLVSKTGM